MLEHGGNLNDAVIRYGIARADWLDLSTGINPHPYPAPVLRADAWHRLPEPSAELVAAACDYYGASTMLPVSGTQAAIQALPQLRLGDAGVSRVAVAAPAYAEHAHRWTRAGHAVREIAYADLPAAVGACDVMVICNPNNPTGASVEPDTLLAWARHLAERGGWLVVDEAFGDTVPALSVAAHAGKHPGLIVLRSVGKFFGLAGLRLGFVAAHETILHALRDWLGPWSVSGPAQQIGMAALTDITWQRAMRARLLDEGERLQSLLAECGIRSSGSALYQWWPQPAAAAFHSWMAQQGIWVRLFMRGAGGIRIGLPPNEQGWRDLRAALLGWFEMSGMAREKVSRG
ncbi:threonine-phosphate decarboxylase CobD [Herbaspirillum sp. RV1423]|uniref:threonine-phosphate decarboxylase CobD n=1 Tax=Herbaspirillum sp. RV1423 TaxID=1443993 RepID=UPI0004AE5E98|nr:threonine-phosphate decarboxylase CobD [Herbaspirillum sp. RV1423]